MEEVKSILEKLQQPKYRYLQFLKAVYVDFITDINDITVWPKSLREQVRSNIKILPLIKVKELVSHKGDTLKVLLKRNSDGQNIEAVLIKHRDGRNTVCVSCMIGCPVGCSFCATGKMGFRGNLTAAEIVEQVLYFARILKKTGERVSNVVFMGMGEPMLNLIEVEEAIHRLTAAEMLGLSDKRITISTSGYVAQLSILIKHGFKGRLAISLHAPEQKLRESLMPVAKNHSLKELFRVLDDYVSMTNKRISYEYILIKGVNDRQQDARDLAKLLKNRLAHVNLIPYNRIKGVDFKTAEPDSIQKFQDILDHNGIHNTIRITMGSDVAAACGQLAGED